MRRPKKDSKSGRRPRHFGRSADAVPPGRTRRPRLRRRFDRAAVEREHGVQPIGERIRHLAQQGGAIGPGIGLTCRRCANGSIALTRSIASNKNRLREAGRSSRSSMCTWPVRAKRLRVDVLSSLRDRHEMPRQRCGALRGVEPGDGSARIAASVAATRRPRPRRSHRKPSSAAGPWPSSTCAIWRRSSGSVRGGRPGDRSARVTFNWARGVPRARP